MNESPREPVVEGCICHSVSFEELLRQAREHGWRLDELRCETGCCTGCTMCEPYVRVVLETGRTRLPVFS